MSKRTGLIGSIAAGITIIVALFCIVFCIERVPVGYEAIVYSMRGGVQNETLKQGWHIVSPSKKVRLFTVGNEQLLLTKDKREGSKGDEAFRVSTSDDASLSISFQMSYRFIPEKIVDTFSKFKGMDGEGIVDSRLRTVLKSRISEVTTDYSLMDIYSGNRSEINGKLTEYLNKKFEKEFGIEVIDASIIDAHPDKQLKAAINNRVEALQKKQQAAAEQETAKVEAETKLIKAKNDAEIKITKAKAEAEANDVIAKSITKELIDMELAEARKKHGWVTVQGSDAVIADATDQ